MRFRCSVILRIARCSRLGSKRPPIGLTAGASGYGLSMGFHVDTSPLDAVRTSLETAREAGDIWVGAMTLSTVSAAGDISARIVYLKAIDATGFVFTSSAPTRKTEDLSAVPRCALTFWWPVLGRQVRAVCDAKMLDDVDRRALFDERPQAHRAATLASPQGTPIDDLEDIRVRAAEFARTGHVDCPGDEQFVAYCLVPSIVELWDRDDADRLHQRTEWRRDGTAWSRRQLAP